MARFYGNIGFYETKETFTGIWEKVIVEKPYIGDVGRDTRRYVSADTPNDSITVSNEISVYMDPFSQEHNFDIAYVEYMGNKWKVSSMELHYPRMTLRLGELYN